MSQDDSHRSCRDECLARVAVLGVLVAGWLGACWPAAALGETDPYAAPFTVTTNPFTFGQDPEFMPNGRVVWGQNISGKSGDTQIYAANENGSQRTCLTCDTPGPNNVPIVRPQGDWILYHSWRGHYITFGSPGYGGIGSELWVMRRDGSHKTQLTETAPGAFVDEGYDDYHAYWSPDGKQIVWTHLNWNFVAGGQGKWDIRVADFNVSPSGVPSLTNVRVVRPANGHWYETQWWAPDGSGFLYTETSGTALDTELFFCRLTSAGCAVTQLTHSPSWNEQAIFTPNGKDVIFMSSRDHPGFFNTYVAAAQDAGLTTSADYLLILPIFEATYFQPVATEATDLYELNLASGKVRRLTTDGNDGWIIPEFAWNPTDGSLWWTELRYPPGTRVPLPVDVAKQLADEAKLLANLPAAPTGPGGNVNATVPTQMRTRILRFAFPSTATPAPPVGTPSGSAPPVTTPTPGCPRATGRLTAKTLGLVTLGMTRARARREYVRSASRGTRFEDFFCLTPTGVRVGYASTALLKTLSRAKRKQLSGRVVWASTSNAFYALEGIRPGATLTAAGKHLKLTGPFHIGLNFWYLAPNGSSTAVLKVRHGIVEEIGIGDKQITQGHRAQLTFLTSFF